MKLIPPPPETVLVRAEKNPGYWHLFAPDVTFSRTKCGLLFRDGVEFTVLYRADGDLCPSCWPWGVEK